MHGQNPAGAADPRPKPPARRAIVTMDCGSLSAGALRRSAWPRARGRQALAAPCCCAASAGCRTSWRSHGGAFGRPAAFARAAGGSASHRHRCRRSCAPVFALLDGIRIALPPLRERDGDLLCLPSTWRRARNSAGLRSAHSWPILGRETSPSWQAFWLTPRPWPARGPSRSSIAGSHHHGAVR